MNIVVKEEDRSSLGAYAEIPMAITVNRILAVENTGLGGIYLREQDVDSPYSKDYDSYPGEGPLSWADQWDLSNWGLFGAYLASERIGGAAVVWNTPGFSMLEERLDLALLLDIRVHPEHQGKGCGVLLFNAAEAWAISKGCKLLKIETQNDNIPACSFYEKQGCSLGAIDRYVYPEPSNEVLLMWYKNLANKAMQADARTSRR